MSATEETAAKCGRWRSRMSWREFLAQKCRIKNELIRLFLAEFLGTWILMTFGNGSVAQSVLTAESAGTFLSVNWAYGFGVMFGVYASFNVSGGHINPAVTLAMAMLGRLQWRKVPVYIVGQFLGTIASSAVVYGVYYDALNNFDGGNRTVVGPTATAGIFATYPKEYVSTWTGLGDQIVGTALLLMCVCAVVDKLNADPQQGLIPLVIGMIVVAIGLAFGSNCGYAINPARDLGPRIFTALAGWGGAVFSFRGYNWFWVPVVGPIVGAILGALTYQIMVGIHWPDQVSYMVEQHPGQGHVNVGLSMQEEGKRN
ncbi:aquaporin-7-like isoform X2 [Lineus longissimus]|uniref:aquaporin-7-like isoform X2 n=1 Tax=Lineus longissimus TaxID=88925 RepID=UPI00315CCFFB